MLGESMHDLLEFDNQLYVCIHSQSGSGIAYK